MIWAMLTSNLKISQRLKNISKNILKIRNQSLNLMQNCDSADTYYAGNELNEAIAIYNKTEGANDYTQFQKAMAIGFKGDTEAKIVELKKLISNFKKL